MSETIFSLILDGSIPCHKVYEDDNTLAFLDIKPCSKGHTVVIPKQECIGALDCTSENYQALWQAVKKVMKLLDEKLDCQGFNIGWNQGPTAGQAVMHWHIHIIPRYEGDNGGSMHSIVNYLGDMKVEDVAKLFET